jgi:glycosyltransferase involved in cell wall biosynthesis
LKDGLPEYLSPEQVNEICNQAAVGLCLSAVEGAMFASMEYMLAGLPIVSTPSIGGRDVYFDEAYCIIAAPDPRQIRDAVTALKQRAIPRDFIAARTRDKVDRDRRRLLALVDDLREQAGRPRRDEAVWPYQDARLSDWRPWATYLAGIAPPAGMQS